MTELQVLDIIRREFRAMRLPLPPGLDDPRMERGQLMVAWRRAAMRIVSQAQTDQRAAARTASQVGFAVTRGRTHL